MHRFGSVPLYRSLQRVSFTELSRPSPGLVKLTSQPPTATLTAGSKRFLKTQRSLYSAVSDKDAPASAVKSSEQSEADDMLDKFGASLHVGSTPTIVTTEAPRTFNSVLTSGVSEFVASAGKKAFTVLPVISWIDKLAQDHGSPAPASISDGETLKMHKKRNLVLRTMRDSYTEIILPFAKDKALLEEYITFEGAIRHGKIMEDLDALAGAISYKHCDDGKHGGSPLTIVTASVDRIDLLKPLGVSDLRLSGHVTFVGYSSMEVFMKMEEISSEQPDKRGDTILVARFTMVARDALTGKAAQVNPMLLQNDAEKRLFQMGEDHKAKKRLAAEQALTKRPPTEDERISIHELYLEYSKYDDPHQNVKKPDDVVWMADTNMSAVHIMQPQDPLDEISFRKPVPIGSILSLDSQIAYSEGGRHHSFQVMVKADVLDILKGTREETNTFWFTFTNPKEAHSTPKVMPRTYAETMLYLDGKRRRNAGAMLAHLSRKNLSM
ncbi:hypothetical protein BGZ98_005616 [Dissophora globulifera]|nr:hypothetical protein BGZ98_005616 [Dissophora globulifera]